MGLLVDGQWSSQWYDTKSSAGRFVRDTARHRNWIMADGSPGPTGEGGFAAEPGRYHLYVSYACPWAHRTLIMRRLKGLDDLITIDAVHPLMLDNGWEFRADFDGATADTVLGNDFLYQVYLHDDNKASGRVTVPVLFDKKTGRIVSNESSEIILMLNNAFNSITGNKSNFHPEELKEEMRQIDELVYENVNNGVYKAGFATSQSVYEEEVGRLFEALDRLEKHMEGREFLCGEAMSTSDIRLFTTLIRFDPVYVGHFKCNLRQIRDYSNLWKHTKRLYNHPGIAETVRFDHIVTHYYASHKSINPTGIIPSGPAIDYSPD